MNATRSRKSLLLAYLLWLTLGIFGAHRLYLGKWFTGLVYLVSFGFYGFGWMLDFLLLPFMVSSTNARLEKEEARGLGLEPDLLSELRGEEEEAAPRRRPQAPGEVSYAAPEQRRRAAPLAEAAEDEDEWDQGPPAWARKRSGFRPGEFLLRVLFFLVAPCLFTVTALMLEQWELLAILIVTLVVGGLIGNVRTVFQTYPMVEKVPLLGEALGYLKGITSFYRRQAPFHFLYYLLFPVLFVPVCCFSERARKEGRLFGRIIAGLMTIILARIGLSYFEVYPPHLGFEDAAVVVLFMTFMIFFWIVCFLVPTATTALSLNASGSTVQARTLVILGLLSGLPVGVGYYFFQREPVPFVSHLILERRLETTSFRKELIPSVQMFLGYWEKHLDDLKDRPGEKVAVNKELTDHFQRHVGGIVVGREAKGFRVLSWQDRQGVWLAVGLWEREDMPPRLLFVSAPDGKVYERWADLPADVTARFGDRSRTDGYTLTSLTLLDDQKTRR
jgi:TM2 domain-containing membrane protein YozV